MQKKCVIYCRVSSEEQAKEGASLEAQERICLSYAKQKTWQVKKIFVEDGVSGSLILRPQLQNLFHYITKYKVDYVLVNKVDRFARGIYTHAYLKNILSEKNVELKSATENIDETPVGLAMENMLAVFAQYYRDNLISETRKGIMERLMQGYMTTCAPVGYANGHRDSFGGPLKIFKKPDCDYIKKLLEDFASGKLATQYEARKWINETIKTYHWRKGLISKNGLLVILTNKFYCGYVRSRKYDLEFKGKHEKLIEEQTYYEILYRLKAIRKMPNKYQKLREDYPLKDILRCDVCGGKLCAGKSKGRNEYYSYYFCPLKHCRLKLEKLEEAFVHLLKKIEPTKKGIELLKKEIGKQLENQKAIVQDNLGNIQKIIQEDQKELNALKMGLINAYKDNNITGTGVITNRIEELKSKLEQDLNTARQTEGININAKQAFRTISTIFQNLSINWENGSFTDKIIIQKLVFPEGVKITKNYEFRTNTITSLYRYIRDHETLKKQLPTPKSATLEPSYNILEEIARWVKIQGEGG